MKLRSSGRLSPRELLSDIQKQRATIEEWSRSQEGKQPSANKKHHTPSLEEWHRPRKIRLLSLHSAAADADDLLFHFDPDEDDELRKLYSNLMEVDSNADQSTCEFAAGSLDPLQFCGTLPRGPLAGGETLPNSPELTANAFGTQSFSDNSRCNQINSESSLDSREGYSDYPLPQTQSDWYSKTPPYSILQSIHAAAAAQAELQCPLENKDYWHPFQGYDDYDGCHKFAMRLKY